MHYHTTELFLTLRFKDQVFSLGDPNERARIISALSDYLPNSKVGPDFLVVERDSPTPVFIAFMHNRAQVTIAQPSEDAEPIDELTRLGLKCVELSLTGGFKCSWKHKFDVSVPKRDASKAFARLAPPATTVSALGAEASPGYVGLSFKFEDMWFRFGIQLSKRGTAKEKKSVLNCELYSTLSEFSPQQLMTIPRTMQSVMSSRILPFIQSLYNY